MSDYVERYYVCGGYGSVKIFDRKHQKYVSGVTFKTEAEAEELVSKLTRPSFVPETDND